MLWTWSKHRCRIALRSFWKAPGICRSQTQKRNHTSNSLALLPENAATTRQISKNHPCIRLTWSISIAFMWAASRILLPIRSFVLVKALWHGAWHWHNSASAYLLSVTFALPCSRHYGRKAVPRRTDGRVWNVSNPPLGRRPREYISLLSRVPVSLSTAKVSRTKLLIYITLRPILLYATSLIPPTYQYQTAIPILLALSQTHTSSKPTPRPWTLSSTRSPP